MATSEIKEALRTAANTVAEYVKDCGVLTVKTHTVEVAAGTAPVLAASTEIKLDGDNRSVVPAVKTADGKWQIDTALYDLHMQNVQAAIAYRDKMMAAMLGLLRGG